jgi:hypothetical protein
VVSLGFGKMCSHCNRRERKNRLSQPPAPDKSRHVGRAAAE